MHKFETLIFLFSKERLFVVFIIQVTLFKYNTIEINKWVLM